MEVQIQLVSSILRSYTAVPRRKLLLLGTSSLAGLRLDCIHSTRKKVLKTIKRPQTELRIARSAVQTEHSLQIESLQTPVSSEELTSLRNLVEQDAHLVDTQSKCRLQKLANAAEKAFAERALLLDENRLLFEPNNESKTRASAKATIAGKAKVMSYEDIVEAQAKRDAKRVGYQ
jgi:hypothetical protein